MAKHVIVIGAGIVGVSTAIWLRRFGQDVTIVDRDGPGLGVEQPGQTDDAQQHQHAGTDEAVTGTPANGIQ